MGLPPCHLLSRKSSTFVLFVALCSIFFVTTAVRLHSDVSQTDEVERAGPTQLSNAHHTSSYQAQKESKRLQFRLSRRSFHADKGGHQSQSSSNVAVNGKFKLTADFQEALKRDIRRMKWLAEKHHRSAHRNNNVNNPESTSPTHTDGGYGEYVVDFLLGTPPQTLSLLMDTGSDLVWAIGDSDHFNAALSSTYSVPSCADVSCPDGELMRCEGNVCSLDYGYADGTSTLGVLSYDTVRLPEEGGGQSNVSEFIFGHSNTTFGIEDLDGIMGLGRGTISFASQVAPQEGSVFSYCLVNWDAPPDVTSPLVFGSDATSSASQFTPLFSNDQGHYLVRVDAISVGGQQVSIPNGTFDIQNDGSGGFIFDSGTTYTHLDAAAYNPLVEAVQAAVAYPPMVNNETDLLCYDISDVSDSTFPEVSFAFHGGAIMNLAQENIYGVLPDNSGVMCLLMTQTSVFYEGPAVFGNMQQQNRHIVYDIQGQRVGWSHPVQCSSV